MPTEVDEEVNLQAHLKLMARNIQTFLLPVSSAMVLWCFFLMAFKDL